MDISVFNDKFYTFYHKDLNFLQDKPLVEIYSHYILYGQKEHRKVIDPLLDESYLKNSNLSYGEYNYIKHKDVPKCNMMKNISSLIHHMQKNKQDFTKTKYVDSKDLNLSDLKSQKKYDIILVNQVDGNTTNYITQVSGVNNGSFVISIRNLNSLNSDTVRLNFAVITRKPL